MWRRRRALFWQQTNYLSAGSTSLFFSFLPWKAIFHVWNGNEWLQWSSIKGTSSSSCREKAWMIFYLNPNTMDLINILFDCFKKKDSDNGGCKKLTAHRVQCTVHTINVCLLLPCFTRFCREYVWDTVYACFACNFCKWRWAPIGAQLPINHTHD